LYRYGVFDAAAYKDIKAFHESANEWWPDIEMSAERAVGAVQVCAWNYTSFLLSYELHPMGGCPMA
jgi:hypothetical protein